MTESSDAYEAYLKGRYFWGKRDTESLYKALEQFRYATELDPQFAEAFAGIADTQHLIFSYNIEINPGIVDEAKVNLERALELKPDSPDALVTLGTIQMGVDWDWKAAQNQFERALELNPSYATAHHWYGLYFGFRGEAEKSRQQMELARQLDPLSTIIQLNLGWSQFVAGNSDAYVQASQAVLEREPNFWDAHWDLGTAYVQKGQLAEGIAELEKAAELAHRSTATLSSLGYALGRAGRRSEAEKILRELQRRASTAPEEIAMIHVALGDKAKALQWLKRAYQSHSKGLLLLRADPWYRPLGSEARYQELLRNVGLPPVAG